MQCNFMHMICYFEKNKYPIKSTRFPELGNIQCETVDIEIQNGHAIHFECIALIIIFAHFKKLLKFLLSSFFCIMLL